MLRMASPMTTMGIKARHLSIKQFQANVQGNKKARIIHDAASILLEVRSQHYNIMHPGAHTMLRTMLSTKITSLYFPFQALQIPAGTVPVAP